MMVLLQPAPWIKTLLSYLDLSGGVSVREDIDLMALWYRWSARSLMPFGRDVAELTGGNPHLYQRVIECHTVSADEADWFGCLQPMFADLFERGYPIRRSFETAYRSAMAYAEQNSAMITEYFGTPEAYANYYATLNSSTNQKTTSQANAAIRAEWTAKAYARNDSGLLAQTYPQAIIYALTEGYANAHTSFDAPKAREDARKRIYDDLLAILYSE
jgi:hypothetical protein